MRPILFVTNHAPPDRAGAFRLLHEREHVHYAFFGGRLAHGIDSPSAPLHAPQQRIRQRDAYRLAASGRFRAVVCGTAGRTALPAAWAGARRARVPFILWASLWAHPRTPAHIFSRPLMARLYRHADAVVTYGPHVTAYVRARGARVVHEAPQAVDNAFWGERELGVLQAPAPFTAVFVGRDSRGKGLRVLLEAWRASALDAPNAALVLAGAGAARAGGAVISAGPQSPAALRNFYATADVLVIPSISTPSFREPWGLVANEAMNQGVPIIASDAVGAVAGGLLRHERNALVVPEDDPAALASALLRMHSDAELRARLGAAARHDVAAYTYAAWASGFSSALADVGASSGRAPC